MSERYERNGRIQRAFSYAYGGGEDVCASSMGISR